MGEWKNKLVYPSNGLLHSKKKKPTTDISNNGDETQKYYAKYKNPDTKKYLL